MKTQLDYKPFISQLSFFFQKQSGILRNFFDTPPSINKIHILWYQGQNKDF